VYCIMGLYCVFPHRTSYPLEANRLVSRVCRCWSVCHCWCHGLSITLLSMYGLIVLGSLSCVTFIIIWVPVAGQIVCVRCGICGVYGVGLRAVGVVE
jgi:hypothetical protein